LTGANTPSKPNHTATQLQHRNLNSNSYKKNYTQTRKLKPWLHAK